MIDAGGGSVGFGGGGDERWSEIKETQAKAPYQHLRDFPEFNIQLLSRRSSR